MQLKLPSGVPGVVAEHRVIVQTPTRSISFVGNRIKLPLDVIEEGYSIRYAPLDAAGAYIGEWPLHRADPVKPKHTPVVVSDELLYFTKRAKRRLRNLWSQLIHTAS